MGNGIRDDLNYSAYFILPLVGFPAVQNYWVNYLLETYIRHEDFTSRIDRFYILIKHDDKLLSILEESDYYIKNELVNKDKDIRLVTYEIDSKFINDVKMFILGRYSKLSEIAKAKIEKFYVMYNGGNRTKLCTILYPTLDDRRKLKESLETNILPKELSSKPDLIKETFVKSRITPIFK